MIRWLWTRFKQYATATTPFLALILVASLVTGGQSRQYLLDRRSLNNIRSIYPHLSGTVFRSICHHKLDEIPFDPKDVLRGDLVYVSPHNLNVFFHTFLDQIEEPFILVTHLSTMSFPGRYAQFLDHPKIAAWFTKNPDRIHPKLHPLPIGISHYPLLKNKRAFQDVLDEPKRDRCHTLLMMFSKQTNRKARAPVIEQFNNAPYCTHLPRRSPQKYYRELRQSVFVLAPRGTGPDTYRVWEALLCGAIPITTHTSVSRLYANLPVIVVDAWSQVTETFLQEQYDEIAKKNFCFEKLHPDYWIAQIERVRNVEIKNPARALCKK